LVNKLVGRLVDAMDNVLILVDYDNVFVTLKNNYRDFRKPNIMYDIITNIKEKYKNSNILSFRLFADFQKVQISDKGYDILKKNQVEIEHVFNGKNASDIILMINCMKYMANYPHINKIVLVSSDSDLIPIFHEIQLLNKKLDVLYSEINISDDYIKHIEDANIVHDSLENLMNVPKYKDCPTLDEFYNSKIADATYFAGLLNKINEIIIKAYHKYLQIDATGKVINAGITKLADLIEEMKELGICPDREFKKPTTASYENIVNMLLDKDILIRHNYTIDGKNFNTLILSEPYLATNSITISNLIKATDYPNT
jgi:Uncharacterized conserved protein